MGSVFHVPVTRRLLLQGYQSSHVRINMQKSPYSLHLKQSRNRLHLQLTIPLAGLKITVSELKEEEKYGIVN